jgi:hypothetical protein
LLYNFTAPRFGAELPLDQEAQVKPNIGLSPEFQIERYKDGLLKQWFAQRQQP